MLFESFFLLLGSGLCNQLVNLSRLFGFILVRGLAFWVLLPNTGTTNDNTASKAGHVSTCLRGHFYKQER